MLTAFWFIARGFQVVEFCSYSFWSLLDFPKKGVRFIDGVEELVGEECLEYLEFGTFVCYVDYLEGA